ncbi:MAG: peptidoglycan DD-metalloendopeptidase family protein [Firmicutes bacterium]|nr:peptidoglycan DD-metalloendopeptidase family protein [Bacillota bacterium]
MLCRDNKGKNQIAESSSSEINKDKAKEQIYNFLNSDGDASYQERVALLKKQVEALKAQKAELEKKETPDDKELKEQQKREFIAAAKEHKKKERHYLIEQQRAIQRKIREESKAEERRLRQQLIDLKKSEKSELRRQKSLAKKSAEMGGGIVNVYGTTITTEIRPVAKVSLRDLLGFGAKKARKEAVTEKEKKAAKALRDHRKEQARQIAAQISELQWERRKNSLIGRRIISFLEFCDKHKKNLLILFSALLTIAIVTAGIFNYYTIFEYSYSGQPLGYVKDKDDVLRITQLVQAALSEDTEEEVVMDARKDISFKRKLTLGHEYTKDSNEMILKRLTYVGDIKVQAYGIFVDGKKIGAVQSKEIAADVLEGIKERYASKKKGSVIEEAVIVEKVKVELSDTQLHDVYDKDEMIEELCRDREKEIIHTIAKGETLESIAKSYNITPDIITSNNENIDPKNLEVGAAIAIKEVAPALTVRMTEVRTYDKTIKFEVEKIKDNTLYKGYSEVKQKGKNGKSELTDRTFSVNGQVVETENLETIVKKEPVTKIINVGNKKRPPTVGSGKYIWPADKESFVVTSEFKWRWGRQHQGIDMGCPIGTDVLAADGGTVTFAGYMGGYGNLVIIDHQNGMETYYGHNNSLCVKVGDKVYQGYHIAESGNTGRSTGPHIHFGIMVDKTFVNPRDYLPSL